MGYLSNANCLRLASIKGQENNRTVLNFKSKNTASHLILQKFLYLKSIIRTLHDTEIKTKTSVVTLKKSTNLDKMDNNPYFKYFLSQVERFNYNYNKTSKIIINFQQLNFLKTIRKLLFNLKSKSQLKTFKKILNYLILNFSYFTNLKKTQIKSFKKTNFFKLLKIKKMAILISLINKTVQHSFRLNFFKNQKKKQDLYLKKTKENYLKIQTKIKKLKKKFKKILFKFKKKNFKKKKKNNFLFFKFNYFNFKIKKKLNLKKIKKFLFFKTKVKKIKSLKLNKFKILKINKPFNFLKKKLFQKNNLQKSLNYQQKLIYYFYLKNKIDNSIFLNSPINYKKKADELYNNKNFLVLKQLFDFKKYNFLNLINLTKLKNVIINFKNQNLKKNKFFLVKFHTKTYDSHFKDTSFIKKKDRKKFSHKKKFLKNFKNFSAFNSLKKKKLTKSYFRSTFFLFNKNYSYLLNRRKNFLNKFKKTTTYLLKKKKFKKIKLLKKKEKKIEKLFMLNKFNQKKIFTPKQRSFLYQKLNKKKFIFKFKNLKRKVFRKVKRRINLLKKAVKRRILPYKIKKLQNRYLFRKKISFKQRKKLRSLQIVKFLKLKKKKKKFKKKNKNFKNSLILSKQILTNSNFQRFFFKKILKLKNKQKYYQYYKRLPKFNKKDYYLIRKKNKVKKIQIKKKSPYRFLSRFRSPVDFHLKPSLLITPNFAVVKSRILTYDKPKNKVLKKNFRKTLFKFKTKKNQDEYVLKYYNFFFKKQNLNLTHKLLKKSLVFKTLKKQILNLTILKSFYFLKNLILFRKIKQLNIKNKDFLQMQKNNLNKNFLFLKKLQKQNLFLNLNQNQNLNFNFFIVNFLFALKKENLNFLFFKKKFLKKFFNANKKFTIKKLNIQKNFYVKKYLKNFFNLKLVYAKKYLFQNLNEKLFLFQLNKKKFFFFKQNLLNSTKKNSLIFKIKKIKKRIEVQENEFHKSKQILDRRKYKKIFLNIRHNYKIRAKGHLLHFQHMKNYNKVFKITNKIEILKRLVRINPSFGAQQVAKEAAKEAKLLAKIKKTPKKNENWKELQKSKKQEKLFKNVKAGLFYKFNQKIKQMLSKKYKLYFDKYNTVKTSRLKILILQKKLLLKLLLTKTKKLTFLEKKYYLINLLIVSIQLNKMKKISKKIEQIKNKTKRKFFKKYLKNFSSFLLRKRFRDPNRSKKELFFQKLDRGKQVEEAQKKRSHFLTQLKRIRTNALHYKTLRAVGVQKKYFSKSLIQNKSSEKAGLFLTLKNSLILNLIKLQLKLKNIFLTLKSNLEIDNLVLENENLTKYSKKLIYLTKQNLINNFIVTNKFMKLLVLKDPFETRKDRFKVNYLKNNSLDFKQNPEYIIKHNLMSLPTRDLKLEKDRDNNRYIPADTLFYQFPFFYNREKFNTRKADLKSSFLLYHLNQIYTNSFYLQKNRIFKKNFLKRKKVFFKPIFAKFCQLNSTVIGDFFIKKLRKHHLAKAISLQLKREMSKFKSLFTGLRLRLSGRFTRKQRAFYLQKMYKKNPLNNRQYNLNYNQVSIPLRYGVVSVKIQHNVASVQSDIKFLSKNYLNYFHSKKIKK